MAQNLRGDAGITRIRTGKARLRAMVCACRMGTGAWMRGDESPYDTTYHHIEERMGPGADTFEWCKRRGAVWRVPVERATSSDASNVRSSS